jgi:hypothetical protein
MPKFSKGIFEIQLKEQFINRCKSEFSFDKLSSYRMADPINLVMKVISCY